jgi:hypothetical protein
LEKDALDVETLNSISFHPDVRCALHQPRARRKIPAPTTSNLSTIRFDTNAGGLQNAHQRGIDHSHGQSSGIAGTGLPGARGPWREHPGFSIDPLRENDPRVHGRRQTGSSGTGAILDREGISYTEGEIAQIKLPHGRGELARAASKLGDANININYAYCGVEPTTNATLVILGVSEVGRAATILDQTAAAVAGT